MTRRARVLLACALVLGLTACTASSADEAKQPSPTAAKESATTEPTAPAYDYDTTWAKVDPIVYSNATIVHGNKGVDAAVRVAVDAVRAWSYNDDLIAATTPEQEDLLAQADEHMTAVAAADWRRLVTDYLYGDKKARHDSVADLNVYAAYGWADPDRLDRHKGKPLALPESGPLTINPRFTSVTAWVPDESNPERRLAIEVKTNVGIRILHGGAIKIMTLNREHGFWMQETRDGWKINGWWGSWKAAADFAPDPSEA